MITDRLIERSAKKVGIELKQTESRKLFSLYKYKVKRTFNSYMHFYKRDLTPVRESIPITGVRSSPYKSNFFNYGVNLSTNDFKKTLLKGMGDSVKCVTS